MFTALIAAPVQLQLRLVGFCLCPGPAAPWALARQCRAVGYGAAEPATSPVSAPIVATSSLSPRHHAWRGNAIPHVRESYSCASSLNAYYLVFNTHVHGTHAPRSLPSCILISTSNLISFSMVLISRTLANFLSLVLSPFLFRALDGCQTSYFSGSDGDNMRCWLASTTALAHSEGEPAMAMVWPNASTCSVLAG